MSSDKRLLLAVGISFLILVFYPVYLKWVTPGVSLSQQKQTALPEQARTGESAENPSYGAREAQPELVQSEDATRFADTLRPGNMYDFSNNRFNAQFTDKGALVTSLEIKNWSKTASAPMPLVKSNSFSKNNAFLVTLANQGIDFRNETFSLEALNEQTGEVRFSIEIPDRWRLVKKFQFDNEKSIIWQEITAKNLSATHQVATLTVSSDLNAAVQHPQDSQESKTVVARHDKLESASMGKIAKKPFVVEEGILWQALAKKYFAIILKPDISAVLFKAWAETKEGETMHGLMQFESVQVPPGGEVKREILIYAGPLYHSELKEVGQGFEKILSHGFFGIFKLWLLAALLWANKVTGNYGWAIILVTCALKLVLTPFTHMSFQSMKKMQAVQPKVKALQERYKNDQTKLSQEMMSLYKKHKVNPMGGCLPMVLQIPVFIAFYHLLVQSVELQGAPFIFWITDLSAPDRLWRLPFSLPVLGDGINLLPLLMLGSMVWQQRLTPQTGSPEQQKIMLIMPIVFGFIFYNLPSGLVLYWFVNNVLSIFHQLFIKGKPLPQHED
jgi:YidC/Oxa1 family membrane protein insertase